MLDQIAHLYNVNTERVPQIFTFSIFRVRPLPLLSDGGGKGNAEREGSRRDGSGADNRHAVAIGMRHGCGQHPRQRPSTRSQALRRDAEARAPRKGHISGGAGRPMRTAQDGDFSTRARPTLTSPLHAAFARNRAGGSDGRASRSSAGTQGKTPPHAESALVAPCRAVPTLIAREVLLGISRLVMRSQKGRPTDDDDRC